jgi:hypothetical protein
MLEYLILVWIALFLKYPIIVVVGFDKEPTIKLIAENSKRTSSDLRRIIMQGGVYLWDDGNFEFRDLKGLDEFIEVLKRGDILLKIGKRNYVRVRKQED